jgi:uncharacterized LabA/DUF88 family protein
MIGTYVKGRTAVFIDAANIYFSQQSLGWRVDFKKLLEYFRKETTLVRIAFYGALNPENDRERKFHDFLEIVGYTVRHKKVKFIRDKNDAEHGGHRKANLDVEITLDAVDLKDQYDSFVLCSGDGDFEPLLKYLKAHGKRCVVISTKGHIAVELVRQAKFLDFKKLKKEIELRK